MIITVTGNYKLGSDIQRLLFGITAYIIPRHSLRIVLSKGDGDEATLAAVERHILESNRFEIEAYKATLDRHSFFIEDFIVDKTIDWDEERNNRLLKSYAHTSLMNQYKLGQLVCSVRGADLENPSDIVVYAGDVNDDDVEYRVIKAAARDAGAKFFNIGDVADITDLFSVLEKEECRVSRR